MNNYKNFLLIIGIIFVGLLFVSGVHNSYGYSLVPKNGLMASLTQLAEVVDQTVSVPVGSQEILNPPMPKESSDFNRQDNGFQDNGFKEEFEERQEDFISPQEIKMVFREINDLKRESKRLLKRSASALKGVTNAEGIRSEISALAEKIQSFEKAIKSAAEANSGVRDAIDEFREAQVWDELNVLRAKIELPKELKNRLKELSRLEKLLNKKGFQALGLDIEGAKGWISKSKDSLNNLNELYNAGNWEEINDSMQDLYENAHPGEVMSVAQRMRELYDRMKFIKDEEVKGAIEEALSEVKDSFNEGDYRSAREVLDNIFNDLQGLVMKASKIGRRGGITEEEFDENLDRIKDIIDKKLGERQESFQGRQSNNQEMKEMQGKDRIQLNNQEMKEPRNTIQKIPENPESVF